MKFQQPKLRKARIEIVPMIDTIFFLLVFFMFTTLSMVKMNGMGLDMPKDGPGGTKAPTRLTIAVAPSGEYFFNAKKIAPAELPTLLLNQISAHPGAVVVVNVAPTQKTQTLISTMDVVNETMTRAGSTAPILVATERVETQAKSSKPKTNLRGTTHESR